MRKPKTKNENLRELSRVVTFADIEHFLIIKKEMPTCVCGAIFSHDNLLNSFYAHVTSMCIRKAVRLSLRDVFPEQLPVRIK
jgi:hypothetical protein